MAGYEYTAIHTTGHELPTFFSYYALCVTVVHKSIVNLYRSKLVQYPGSEQLFQLFNLSSDITYYHSEISLCCVNDTVSEIISRIIGD